MNCHCCNGKMMKFGKFRNANRIVQRYRCVRCTKTFSEAQPLDGLRVDFKQACQVANMLCEGIGIRAISRLTGLFIAHFNFCRVHSAHGRTPAMAAGLTNHIWTVAQLLDNNLM